MQSESKIIKEEEKHGMAFNVKRVAYSSAVSILVVGEVALKRRVGKKYCKPHKIRKLRTISKDVCGRRLTCDIFKKKQAEGC